MNEALKVSYGASGLNIEVGSLYSAIIGGITVVTTLKEDEKISKEEPNSKRLEEINNILFSAASNNLYAVTVVQDSCIKKEAQYLEKDDAEKLFVKYCLEYYNENGLEQYCENKGCRSLDELSIEEFEYYFHSEAWYDVNDTANVEIKVM